MDLEIYARRFLAQFGIKAQLNKLHEEVFELADSIYSSDGLSDVVSEFADVRNILAQLEVYVAESANISLKMIDALIVNERIKKNERTERRIKDNYYDKIIPVDHRFVDLGDLTQGNREMILNMIETARRSQK